MKTRNRISLFFSCLLLGFLASCYAGNTDNKESSNINVTLDKDNDHHVYTAYSVTSIQDNDEVVAFGIAKNLYLAKKQIDSNGINSSYVRVEINDKSGSFASKLFEAKQKLYYYLQLHDNEPPIFQPDLFMLYVFKKFQLLF